jgi:hypothetical protein
VKPTEKQVQAGVVKALRMLGAAVWDTSQPHRAKITPGLPDLLVFHRGRFIFAEVKRPGGRLTPAQRTFRDECEAAGVAWACWRSAEEAVEWAINDGRG